VVRSKWQEMLLPFAPGGRPAHVQVMPDGALLGSDDGYGMIYRITYGEQK